MNIIAVASILATVFAALAAGFAAWAAFETRRAARGELVARLLDEYSQPGYLKAGRRLSDWKTKTYQDFKDLEKTSLVTADFDEINEARRLVKFYFRKVQSLQKGGYLSKDDVRGILAQSHRVALLFNPVEVLEAHGYEREMYDFYDGIYKEIDRPRRNA